MQLIAVFNGFDGAIGAEVLDDIEITGATVRGNRIDIHGDDRIVAHAVLEVVGKTALWHLFKGQRGKEIGIATDVSFYV